MNCKLKLVYFSATGSTKNILHKISEFMNIPIDQEFNLTNYEHKDFKHTFEKNDIILLGFPVYGGRVPRPARNRFLGIKGNCSKIALVLTYGDMHYSNSMNEIYEIVKNNGFEIIGMGIFVSQHSIIKSIVSDRPNEKDFVKMAYFGEKIVQNIFENKIPKSIFENVKTYGKYHILPIKPKGNKNCNKCGLCSKLCPENAIEINDPRKTCRNKCICCMRCVKYCPQKARDLTKIEYLIGEIFLKIMRKTFFNNEKEVEIVV